jgi:hypothetical protein
MRGRGVLRLGVRSGLLGVVLAILFSASALATRIHVSVSGPRTVVAFHQVVLHLTGYTRAPFGWLAFFLDNRTCARTGVQEANRPEILHEYDFGNPPRHRALSGNFSKTFVVGQSYPGTHYLCAYLVRRSQPHDTKARGSWKYVTS